MAKCVWCGEETDLFIAGNPFCLKCEKNREAQWLKETKNADERQTEASSLRGKRAEFGSHDN
jgi:hypothetical protein